MEIIERYINKNLYSLKAPKTMNPVGICVHNTYNNASATNEIKYMSTNKVSTSFHTAIDDKQVIKGIPYNRTTNACGDRYGNENYIQIEICYSTGSDTQFTNSEKNASKYITQLLLDYGWNLNNIRTHKSFSGKNCPHKTMEKGWTRFLEMVQHEYICLQKNKSYLVKVDCDVLNVRREPSTASNVVTQIKRNEVYTIVETKNNWGKLKSGVGWISLNYTRRV